MMAEAADLLVKEICELNCSGEEVVDIQGLAGDLAFDVIAAAGLRYTEEKFVEQMEEV